MEHAWKRLHNQKPATIAGLSGLPTPGSTPEGDVDNVKSAVQSRTPVPSYPAAGAITAIASYADRSASRVELALVLAQQSVGQPSGSRLGSVGPRGPLLDRKALGGLSPRGAAAFGDLPGENHWRISLHCSLDSHGRPTFRGIAVRRWRLSKPN